MSTSSEFCFTFYSSVKSISWTIGHLLKITSYFYLFRGVFISAVIYPYDELEHKNNKLEAANAELNSMSVTMNAILDVMPIAIQKYDSQGRLKYINKKFTELLECDGESLIGTSIQDSVEKFGVVAYDGKNLETKFDQYSDKNEITAYTLRTGKLIRLSIATHELRGGRLLLIHETKKEQELQNLHIQTETILASINNSVLIINDEKKIVLCNKAFEDIFELQKEEILGMDIDSFNQAIHFELLDLPDKALKNELDKNVFETKFTSGKGNKKEIMLYVGTIKNVEEVNRIISEFLFLSRPRETELAEISMHDMFASIKSMVETSSLVKGVDFKYMKERYRCYVGS